jgi:hypothetical protein
VALDGLANCCPSYYKVTTGGVRRHTDGYGLTRRVHFLIARLLWWDTEVYRLRRHHNSY